MCIKVDDFDGDSNSMRERSVSLLVFVICTLNDDVVYDLNCANFIPN